MSRTFLEQFDMKNPNIIAIFTTCFHPGRPGWKQVLLCEYLTVVRQTRSDTITGFENKYIVVASMGKDSRCLRHNRRLKHTLVNMACVMCLFVQERWAYCVRRLQHHQHSINLSTTSRRSGQPGAQKGTSSRASKFSQSTSKVAQTLRKYFSTPVLLAQAMPGQKQHIQRQTEIDNGVGDTAAVAVGDDRASFFRIRTSGRIARGALQSHSDIRPRRSDSEKRCSIIGWRPRTDRAAETVSIVSKEAAV